MQFEQVHQTAGTLTEDMYPLRAEYNRAREEIIVCTRKDVRYIDARDGRIKKILTGLVRNAEDEISQFRSLNQFKLFILADQRGGLRLHSYASGERVKEL